LSERADSVLIVPFGSQGVDGPTTLHLSPERRDCRVHPGSSHFIPTLKKSLLRERLPRPLSAARMRQVSLAIQRAFDPDSFVAHGLLTCVPWVAQALACTWICF
jgi:hypothetical protein